MGSLEILAGIGLILFGVRFLRKGLDRLFGTRLIGWISHSMASPFLAFGMGVGVGAVAPSSTGIAVLATQILPAVKAPLSRMLAVVLGANVGLTIAVQFLAFRIGDWAGLLLIIGVGAFLYLKRDLLRGIGQCIFSLGLIFLAIRLIGNGAQTITQSPDIVQLLTNIQSFPVLILFAATLLGFILQSSTAAIGMGYALASTGLLTDRTLAVWVMGTMLGLTLTLTVAGAGTLKGRRLAMANLLTKAIVIFPLFFLPSLTDYLFNLPPGSVMRQTAMFYTGLNLGIGLLFLPLLKPLEKLVHAMFPDPEDHSPLEEKRTHLDEQFLDSPSLALARATRELQDMSDSVAQMLHGFHRAFLSRSAIQARRVQAEDDRIDKIFIELNRYLSRIVGEKNQAESHWHLTLLRASNELESVGDLIDLHLCEILIKQLREEIVFLPNEQNVVRHAFQKTIEQLELASGYITLRSDEHREKILENKENFNDWAHLLQTERYEHLAAASPDQVRPTVLLLDYLNTFRRIHSHLSALPTTS